MRKLVLCLALAVSAAIHSDYHADDQEPAPIAPPVNYSCEIPYDVTLPDPTAFDRQVNFDVYSWNSFIALNWPADTATSGAAPCNLQNGVARDCGKPLPRGDYGPTVWETFKPEWAIFRGSAQGAIAPAGWNCPLDPLPGCDSLEAKDAAHAGIASLRMIIKDANTAAEFKQAGTFAPLIDQAGSFVRYEMRVNRDEFEFIDANKLWDSNNHKADVDFQPSGSNERKTYGPIEVKAAWKVLTDKDNRERYHTRTVEIAWPKPGQKGSYLCKQYTMGLVGLHIAHKTQNAPQWIWSTFEQVDNYKGEQPSFNDPHCPAEKCKPNFQPDDPEGGWNGDPRIRQIPSTQVVAGEGSAAAVRTDAAKLNAEVRQKLAGMGSVWQYYELVSTQWPSVPYIKGKPAAVLEKATLVNQGAGQIPHLLANSTMETYLMGPDQDSNTSSCMLCHSKARTTNRKLKADFTYLLQEAFPKAAEKQISLMRRQELGKLFHKDTAKGGQPTKAIAPKK